MTKTKQNDPAYWLLVQGRNDPSKRSKTTVYNEHCYICNDPEFSLMGLPLCYPCVICGAHVPADDPVCDNEHTQPEDPEEEAEMLKEWKENNEQAC